jgi:Na+/melibiose symporter-like transporter
MSEDSGGFCGSGAKRERTRLPSWKTLAVALGPFVELFLVFLVVALLRDADLDRVLEDWRFAGAFLVAFGALCAAAQLVHTCLSATI